MIQGPLPPPLKLPEPKAPDTKKHKKNEGGDFVNQEDELAKKISKEEKDINSVEADGLGLTEEQINNLEKKQECPTCKKQIVKSAFEHHFNNHASKIMDYLYLGALYNSRNFNELYEYLHIRSILNAAIECGNYFPDSFEYLKCDLYDEISEDISKHMEQALNFIETEKQKGRNIFVHCIQGISRSATIVIAYLMKYEKMTLKESFDHCKAIRSIVRPNPAFTKFLLQFEVQLYGQNSCNGNHVNPSYDQFIKE